MTRKEQNKILDNKIESNVNQYKVDRLNAEISAFSSGDLNKYEFLIRTDLKYKPNALDKARFECSSLGKAFSTGLDKNADGYQEEGVIKLLKYIRDGLAGGNRPNDNANDRPDRPDNETQIVIKSLLDKIDDINKQYKDTQNNIKKQNDNYFKKIKEQNDDIEKLKKEVKDNKNLTKDVLDEAGKNFNKIHQERLKYLYDFKLKLKENFNLLEKIQIRNERLQEIARNYRDNFNLKDVKINVLNRDIDHLQNNNQESLDVINVLIDVLTKLNYDKDDLENDKEI